MIKDYYISEFGSSDSLDLDLMICLTNVDKQLTLNYCKSLCSYFDDIYSNIYDKEVNSNLCVINNGVVVWVYKGTVDEVNNSLYYTARPKIISELLPRNKELKIIRCTRSILQLLSRSKYRTEVKKALKSNNILTHIDTLKSIDFNVEFDLVKENWIEFRKTIMFQMIQTLSLIDDIEIYEKSQAVDLYDGVVEVYNCIYRKQENNTIISKFINIFCNTIINRLNIDLDINKCVECKWYEYVG